MPPQPEYILAGVLMKQHLAAEQTAGAFSLFENRSSGMSRTPIHVHENDDETLYVLEGELYVLLAGSGQALRAGQTVFLPRGIPHQLENVSGLPAHYLLLCTPSGFERFLAAGGHLRSSEGEPQPPTREDLDRLRTAAPQFGITLLDKWPD